jgi:PKD repeat protein
MSQIRKIAFVLALAMLSPAFSGALAWQEDAGVVDSDHESDILTDGSLLAPNEAAGTGFLKNAGQFHDPGVLYYGKGEASGIAFLQGRVLLNVVEAYDPALVRDLLSRIGQGDGARGGPAGGILQGCTVSLTFPGGNPVLPEARGELPGTTNYFIGRGPADWHTCLRRYSEVVYEGLYEGIDLVYRSASDGVKYEFVVAPGADPSAITVHVEGQDSLGLREDGLVIHTVAGDLVDTGLVAFYGNAPHERVDCSLRLVGEDRYGFQLGSYDGDREVVIDPLVTSTYIGGKGVDMINGMVLTDKELLVVVGTTGSDDFPTTTGAYRTDLAGSLDAFVARFSKDGTKLEYATYIGGSRMDIAKDVAITGSGAVFVAGSTESDRDFPIIRGAMQPGHGGGVKDGFIAQLAPTGGRLDISTYFGGSGGDVIEAMVLDAKEAVYVTGQTYSDNLKTTTGAFQESYGGGRDAFVAKVKTDGTGLIYSTYLGGSVTDTGYDVEVDAQGHAYVTGSSLDVGMSGAAPGGDGYNTTSFPTTAGCFQDSMGAATSCAFVTKVATDGKSLVYSTFLGGSMVQEAFGLALGSNGTAHVVGQTHSRDFPVTSGAFQRMLGGEGDAFITQLNEKGNGLVSSTFLGGNGDDCARGVALDDAENVHLCGSTNSKNFPTTPKCPQASMAGWLDAFFSKLAANYTTLMTSTYMGGGRLDDLLCVVTGSSYAYAAGNSESFDYPTTEGSYQPDLGGMIDGVITKLSSDNEAPVAVAGPDVTVDQHETVRFNGSASKDDWGIANWTWAFEYNGSHTELYGPTPSFTFHEAGVYAVELTILDTLDLVGKDALNVTVRDITSPVPDAGHDRTVRQHDMVTFDGTGSRDNVGVASWMWSLTYQGEERNLSGPDPTFTFDVVGEYLVTLNVSDEAGNWAVDTLTVSVIDDTAPVVDLGPDIVIDQHESVELNGTRCVDSDDVVNFTWTISGPPGPVVLFGPLHVHTFDDAGAYEVSLSVRDGSGNKGMGLLNVTVRDSTPPVVDAGQDRTVRQYEEVRFDGSLSTDNVIISDYTWTFEHNGRTETLKGLKPGFVFIELGTFVVTLTVADGVGNEAEDTVIVTVLDATPPVCAGLEDVTVDQHAEVRFDGSQCTDNVGIASWSWTFVYGGGPQQLSGPSPSFVFDGVGAYTVTLVIEDAAGLNDSATMVVTVLDTTDPVADPGDDRTVDQGTSVTLDGSASTDNVGVQKYTWTFDYEGQIVTLYGAVNSHVFDEPGTYEVKLTAQDIAGNAGEGTFVLTVRDTVAPVPVAKDRHTVGRGDKLSLDGSASTDNVGVVRWVWTFEEDGRPVELEGEVVEHSFDEAGDYEVTLTVYDAEGNSASRTITVTVEGAGWLAWVALAAAIAAVALAYVAIRMRGRAP